MIALLRVRNLKVELFESIFCYFPIAFTPPPDDPFGITPDQLSMELEAVLLACFSSATLSIIVLEALVERLEDDNGGVSRVILNTISRCFSTFENWNTIRTNSSLIARLLSTLVVCLKSNPSEVVSIFHSSSHLLIEAKETLLSLSHSIFVNATSVLSDDGGIIPALFELGAIDNQILDQVNIDPRSATFISFLSHVTDKLPASGVEKFARKLDAHLEVDEKNLQNLPFISAAIQALKRLGYYSENNEKILLIQKSAIEAIIEQAGNSKTTLQTLIETQLLKELAPSLYSALLSIQALAPHSSLDGLSSFIGEQPNCLKDDHLAARGCHCVKTSSQSCNSDHGGGSTPPWPPQSNDVSAWLSFLSLNNNSPTDATVSIAAVHPCVWVRLALIRQITDSKHLDNLLSDSKRIVRRAAAAKRLALMCNINCCKS